MGPNANEIATQKKKNVQRKKFVFGTKCNLYSTDLRQASAFGVTQILKFAFGVTQILKFALGNTNFRVFKYQHKDPTQMFLRCSGI